MFRAGDIVMSSRVRDECRFPHEFVRYLDKPNHHGDCIVATMGLFRRETFMDSTMIWYKDKRTVLLENV